MLGFPGTSMSSLLFMLGIFSSCRVSLHARLCRIPCLWPWIDWTFPWFLLLVSKLIVLCCGYSWIQIFNLRSSLLLECSCLFFCTMFLFAYSQSSFLLLFLSLLLLLFLLAPLFGLYCLSFIERIVRLFISHPIVAELILHWIYKRFQFFFFFYYDFVIHLNC